MLLLQIKKLNHHLFFLALTCAPLGYFFKHTIPLSVSVIFWMILIYPILEEILFRGLLQPFIHQKIPFKISLLSFANFITSLIFCLLHVYFFHNPYSFLVFFPSLVFGLLKEKISLFAAIICHSFYNLAFLLLGFSG